MSYPPLGFNWNWTDLAYDASLSDVISTVNWIGQNLNDNFTDWIEDNNSDMYDNVEAAKDSAADARLIADNAQASADDAEDAANDAQNTADEAKAIANAATDKISRCSYLRGTH